jgi:hypothetical protein
MKNILTLAFCLLVCFSFSAVPLHAIGNPTGGTGSGTTGGTGNGPGTTITLDNPFKAACGDTNTCGLYELLQAIVHNIVLPIGGVLAVLGFIWSGFLYVMAQGNATKIKDATRALSYTAIGTALLLGAYAISDVISGTLTQFGGPAGLK